MKLNKEIKILEKKYNNFKYEISTFSSPEKNQNDKNNKFNYIDQIYNSVNNNNNNIISDYYNRSSNLSHITSVFNIPNLVHNNEMNVDELIEELENKLSFIKLQNAQISEKDDFLYDEINLNENLNKVIP